MAMIGEVQTPAVNWGVTGLTDVACTVIDLINETTETPSVSEVGSLGTYKANWTPSVENFYLIIFTSEAANRRSTIWWPVNKGMLYRAHGLFYIGTCDSGMAGSQTTIVCDDLAGFGDDYFNTEWSMKVILNANNHGVAPEGTAAKDITDYVSLTGTFTVAAFGANVEAGDVILIKHASIGGDATAANQATIIAYVDDLETRLTAARAAYLDNLNWVSNATNATHDITTANDTTETLIVEINPAHIFDLTFHLDLDALETAAEGGIITIRAYRKIDASNYSDIPSASAEYQVGSEDQYPGFKLFDVHDICKFTIQCSDDVTATRTIAYEYVRRQTGP